MCDLLQLLGPNAQRGSKPRCHAFTHGTPDDVSGRLTALIKPWGRVGSSDHWMPQGFDDIGEARLDQSPQLVESPVKRDQLRRWWLTVPRSANTPNWDIASTCTIGGRTGFLLLEAKSHRNELQAAEAGKPEPPPGATNSWRNHSRIGWCIEDASLALSGQTQLPWSLSRDSRYQMSNRFAWAWKLTELGYPVVLVYLGFLNAVEMSDRGEAFAGDDWSDMVRAHSAPLFPPEVWGNQWTPHGQTFVPLIRTVEQHLCCAGGGP